MVFIMKNTKINVSVIIVNYNNCMLLRNCLNSIINQTKDITYEVIVADNASKDNSVKMIETEFQEVVLIKLQKNVGFGRANNAALEKARGEFVLYLNNDTIFLNNVLKIFYDYWKSHENESLGAIGCVLVNGLGETIHSGGKLLGYQDILRKQFKRIVKNCFKTIIRLTNTKDVVRKMIWASNYENVRPGDVEYVTGADLFVRNNSYARFDSNYFMYFEDADLQIRMKEHGFKSRLITGPEIVHYTKKENPEMQLAFLTDVYFQISSIYYLKKNFHQNCRLLKILIKADWINPYMKNIVTSALEQIKKGKYRDETNCK